MSWSFSCIGKANAVIKELRHYATTLEANGESRKEFEEALPHLEALVRQNFVSDEAAGYPEPLIDLEANGSGSTKKGPNDERTPISRSCTVKIYPLYKKLAF